MTLHTAYPMRLRTDYMQSYDAFFDLEGPEFVRNAAPPAGYSKREQFRLLRDVFGLVVPRHGLVRDISGSLQSQSDWLPGAEPRHYAEHALVVYQDEYLHAGRGKRPMHPQNAQEQCPDLYACEFIPSERDQYNRSRSIKATYIGGHLFLHDINAHGSWMTNDPDNFVVCVNLNGYQHESAWTTAPPGLKDFAPLWSVDLVPHLDTKVRYAVDLNMAPGLQGLGIEELLRPVEIAEALKVWCQQHPDFYFDYSGDL